MARLLFVHAHPDDESLATGVTIAHYALGGHEAFVLTCTLGEEGEVIPPGLRHLAGDELARHRARELSEALAQLGAGHVLLGERDGQARYRDSGMAGTPSADHPRAFVNADLAAAAALVAQELERLQPHVVVTYDEQGTYGHPDHIQTRRVTAAALARWNPTCPAYEVVTPRGWVDEDRAWLARNVPAGSGLLVPGPGDPYAASVVDDAVVTSLVVDAAAREQQVRALRAHRTQVTLYDGYYTLSNNIAARLAGREAFVRFDPRTGRRWPPPEHGPATGLLEQTGGAPG